MPLQLGQVGVGELVRELSPDALRYFTEMELSDDWPSYTNPRIGKFVRLGAVILLGSTINYGTRASDGARRSLLHRDMLWHGLHGMGKDVQDRITATAPERGNYLHDTWPLVDAGVSVIALGSTGQPGMLLLRDRSGDFGQATEAVRQQTGAIAQQVVGRGIAVIAEV